MRAGHAGSSPRPRPIVRTKTGRAKPAPAMRSLADAVTGLTEAARLRRPLLEQAASGGRKAHPTRTEPADWAAFPTLYIQNAGKAS